MTPIPAAALSPPVPASSEYDQSSAAAALVVCEPAGARKASPAGVSGAGPVCFLGCILGCIGFIMAERTARLDGTPRNRRRE